MKKNNLILIISLLVFIMLVGGVSYSFFVYNREIAAVSLNTGDISIDLENINGNLYVGDAIPLTDYEGKNSEKYLDFTVNATADIEPILYEVEIIPKSNNTLDSQYVKLYLTDQEGNVIIEPFKYSELYNSMHNNGKTLCQDLVVGNNDGTTRNYTKNYRLRIWISEDYTEITSKTFGFDINVYAINVNASEYVKATFDVQDGRELAKYVKINDEYGDMPTPVRIGYTFLGWNGKNLFNKAESLIEGIRNDTNFTAWATTVFNNNWVVNNLNPNTTYTINYDIECTNVPEYDTRFDGKFEAAYGMLLYSNVQGNNDVITGLERKYLILNEKLHLVDTFVTTSTIADPNVNYRLLAYTNRYLNNNNAVYSTMKFSNIQIEEGSEATVYEPYYVTNSIDVTRNRDHTLKAIWAKSVTVNNQNISNYQEVEYIESTGIQYIDTGVLGNKEIGFDIEVKVNEYASEKGIFATSRATGGPHYVLQVNSTYVGLYLTNPGNNSTSFVGTYQSNSNTDFHNLKYNINGDFKIVYDNSTISTSPTHNTPDIPYSYSLFARKYGTTVSNFSKLTLKYARIYESGSLVRDFIPSYRKNDGEIGLYDKVNNVFYQNAGQGDFIKGPNVTS